jgi:hypothetical protein
MVASEDRSINPIQERMMAKRAHAKTVEVPASHVAYMSHPKEPSSSSKRLPLPHTPTSRQSVFALQVG